MSKIYKIGIILLFVMIGCTEPPSVFEEVFTAKGIDFVKYSDKGFLFTTEEYKGDYSSVGIVNVNYIPKAVFRPGNYYGSVYNPIIQDEIDLQKAIDKIYRICIEMKADALMNLNFEQYEIEYPVSTRTINGIHITGFAIKRIGAFK